MRTIRYRRKRLGLTNYKKRLALLKSNLTRLVIRRSNKFISLQMVNYEPDGDRVLLTMSSKGLGKFGWKHSFKSLPAAYLTGLMVGKVALDKNIKEAIVDIGMFKHIKGSKFTAVIKGVIDAGLKIPVGDIFPSEDRLSGKHINDEVAKDFESVKAKLIK